MIIVIEEKIEYMTEIIARTAEYIIADFDVGVGAVKKNLFTEAGDILIATGVANVTVIPIGESVSGDILTYDPTLPKLVGWKTPAATGISVEMTNGTDNAIAAGDVVIFDTSGNEKFKTTTVPLDLRVCGVAAEAIEGGAAGKLKTVPGDVVTVNCTSPAIAIGQFLSTSTTAGKAQGAGFFRTMGVFAIALTSKVVGAGTVQAMLIDNYRQAIAGAFGYALGGENPANTSTANSQRLTMANDVWATVASAALPLAIRMNEGVGNTTVAAYSIGGYTTGVIATAYKMPYATEIMAAEAGANCPYGIYSNHRFGANALLKGYLIGGYSGSAATSYAGRLTFSTSTAASLGAVMSSARYDQCGMSDGTYVFVEGGLSSACDKITVATDAFAAHADGNLPASGAFSTFSFSASSGYIHNSSYARKIPFATGVNAANPAGVVPFATTLANGATDGIAFGYCAGSATLAACYKFSVASETWAASSDMALSKDMAACASYGAY